MHQQLLAAYPAPGGGGGSWVSQYAVPFNGNETGWSGYTLRIVFPALANAGTKLRLTVGGYTGGSWSIGALYLGHRAGSGDNYDFASTPSQVTVAGSPTWSGTTSDIICDEVPGTFNIGDRIMMSVYFPTAPAIARTGTALASGSVYYKSGNDASTVDATGYTIAAQQDARLARRLEVWVP